MAMLAPYNIPLKDIREYLIEQGWKIEKFSDTLDRLIIVECGRPFEYFFPSRESLADYTSLIMNMVRNIAKIQGKTQEKILHLMRNRPFELDGYLCPACGNGHFVKNEGRTLCNLCNANNTLNIANVKVEERHGTLPRDSLHMHRKKEGEVRGFRRRNG